ncbi:MAG: hypothetical protein JO337_04940 [Acidimicrobiales bacterium]|nr:hypothetical protein [Acidimicrobiales bacterium]
MGLVSPIQEAYKELASDPDRVADVLRTGALRADKVASATLERAYDAIGMYRRT